MAVMGQTPLHICARIAASLLGSYAFTWGICAFGVAASVALGADFEMARIGMGLLGFLILLGAFLWAFAEPRLTLVWAVLMGTGAVLTTGAWALQSIFLRGLTP